jgi:hypothetical protein
MEATYLSFANGKICSDKNYMDVIFITSPGNCFMSWEDFPKNITLKDRPKDFHLSRHQTMNQVLPDLNIQLL